LSVIEKKLLEGTLFEEVDKSEKLRMKIGQSSFFIGKKN